MATLLVDVPDESLVAKVKQICKMLQVRTTCSSKFRMMYQICYTNRLRKKIMNKKRSTADSISDMVSEPIAMYGQKVHCDDTQRHTSTKERIKASTVSVDEYFDKLLSQIHSDYAKL